MSWVQSVSRRNAGTGTVLAGCAAAIMVLASSNVAFAQANWNGSTSTDYFTAANWTTGTAQEARLPDPGQEVNIGNISFTNNVVYDGNNGSATGNFSVMPGATFTMNSGTFLSGPMLLGNNNTVGSIATFNLVSGSVRVTGNFRTSAIAPSNLLPNSGSGTNTSYNQSGGFLFVQSSSGNNEAWFAGSGSTTQVVTTAVVTGGTFMSNGRIHFGASPGNVTNAPAYVKLTMSGGVMAATNISNNADDGRGTLQFNAGDITLSGGILRGTDISSRDGVNIGGMVPNAGVKMNGGVMQVHTDRTEGTVYAVPAGVDPVDVTPEQLNRGQWRMLDGSLALNWGNPDVAGSGRGYSELFTTGTSGASYRYAVRVWMTTGTNDIGAAKKQANAFATNPADVNLDGIVDQSDRNYMNSQFDYTYTADPLDVPGGVIAYFRADATGDGVVNASDVAVLNDLYGQRTQPGGVYAWASDQTVEVTSGSANQAGNYTFANTKALTKTGAGELVFNGSNSYTYPTTVSAGKLTIASSAAFTLASSTVTVQPGATLQINPGVTMMAPKVTVDGTLEGTGASIAVSGATGIRQLAIGAAGSVAGSPAVDVSNAGSMSLSSTAPSTVNVSALSVDEVTGGTVDLGRGAVNIAAGGMTSVALVADLIAGRDGGTWAGAGGITSSAAAAALASGVPRAVGWIDNGGGSLTAAYAAPGDTNIDWTIDILDASNFLAGGKFDSGSPADWMEGDFGYDGVVDILDAADFFSTALFDAGNYNTAPGLSGGVAAVPEPATWGLVAGAAACAAGRSLRRRQGAVRA